MFLKLLQRKPRILGQALQNIYTASPALFQNDMQRAASRLLDKKTDSRTPALSSPTNLVHSLKMVSSSYELFELVSLKRSEFGSEHVMQALRSLFNLQKQEKTAIHAKHILKNPDFENLCRNLKSVSRTLNVNDIIEAVKILNFVGVPPNSDICMTMLHLLRTQINDITLGQIIFLEFLMKRFQSTPLVDAFRIALPMLMQIQLGTKMDHENTSELTDLLQFAACNPISEQCVMNIVSALTMHGTELTEDEARSIVWSLCDLPNFDVNYEKLMFNCMEVLCDSMDKISFANLETTLSKMTNRYFMNTSRSDAFYHEEFFGRCARLVVVQKMSLENAIYMQRKFNKMSYVNTDLIDYIADEFARKPELLSSANQTFLKTFISSMSTPYYKPLAWDGLKEHVLKNPIIRSTRTDFPGLRFVLELIVLDIFDHERINLLCDPEFLRHQSTRSWMEYLHVLLLHQTIETLIPNYEGNRLPPQIVQKATEIQKHRKEISPMREAIELAFGGAHNIYSQVESKLGHNIDHVLVFDSDGEIVPRNDSSTEAGKRLEDIQVADGQKMVAIMIFPISHYCLNVPRLKGMFELRIRTLEALGVSVCAFNLSAWQLLADREKVDYIAREVRHKL